MPDQSLLPVKYVAKRIIPDLLRMVLHQDYEEEFKRKVLSTKFNHWRYEQEVRRIIRLESQLTENGMFFFEFSNQLSLKEVIVGAQSAVTREQLNHVLDDLRHEVACRKARLAFRTFSVVEQRKLSLWA